VSSTNDQNAELFTHYAESFLCRLRFKEQCGISDAFNAVRKVIAGFFGLTDAL
jgi:hypothetical protein